MVTQETQNDTKYNLNRNFYDIVKQIVGKNRMRNKNRFDDQSFSIRITIYTTYMRLLYNDFAYG